MNAVEHPPAARPVASNGHPACLPPPPACPPSDARLFVGRDDREWMCTNRVVVDALAVLESRYNRRLVVDGPELGQVPGIACPTHAGTHRHFPVRSVVVVVGETA